ncbi:MAG TPA: 50S ribosomal protein L17 [Armatimonadetes bacterium]|nr:50S ribosomal protein L17 [Armatimonadota bacterium]
MRHRKKGRGFSRPADHRMAMLKNLVASLFIHERVETTVAKAKEARRIAEKLITIAKEDTVHARRQVRRMIPNPLQREVVNKLFLDIAPRYRNRNGGYTRIVKAGLRRGDGAQMAVLMLVE